MKTFEVYHRDYDLPKEAAYRVELKGAPRDLDWPKVCPSCGAPADERLVVRKTFRRHGRTWGWRYLIRSAEIPFCSSCVEQHRALERRMSAEEVFFMTLKSPTMIAFAGATSFAVLIARIGWEKRDDPYAWVFVPMFLLFFFTAAWSLFASWWSTRFHRVPPQTEITRACDFSDNLGNPLVGERHVYAIRDERFATEFREANANRVFTEDDRKRARRIQSVWGMLFLLVVVIAALLARMAGVTEFGWR